MNRPSDQLRTPLPRALTLLCGTLCLFQWAVWSPRLVAPSVLLLLSVSCLAMIVLGYEHHLRRSWVSVALVVAVGLSAVWMMGLSATLESPAVAAPVILLLGGGAVCSLRGRGRLATAGYVVVLVVVAGLALRYLEIQTVVIDVADLLQDGIDALLRGESPYGITVPNRYSPEDTARVYGPGVVEDGRVIYGYPYLPAPLLLDVPAHLLGEVRWMHLGAVLATGAIGWRLATDALGRAAAVLLVVNPLTLSVVAYYWVEPVISLLLSLAVLAVMRGSRWAALPLGVFFASKQYAVSYVPALWSVARSAGWPVVAWATLVGAVVVSVLIAMDPGAFVHSVVGFHLAQPFREDAMSLMPGLEDVVGPIPEWLLTISPVWGLLVSLLIVLRTRPGATAFSLGVGLSLLITVLWSKQGALNYFSLIGTALLLAGITWTRDDPLRTPGSTSTPHTREPSSQGSRGGGPIVATR